jgi:hypothetical protein
MSCTLARMYILSVVLTGKCLANKLWNEGWWWNSLSLLKVLNSYRFPITRTLLNLTHQKSTHADSDYSTRPTESGASVSATPGPHSFEPTQDTGLH